MPKYTTIPTTMWYFKYSQASKKKKHDLGKLEYINFFRYMGKMYTLNIVHSNCAASFEV